MLKRARRPSPPVPSPSERLRASLARRMAQPQRHRLLHGFPMVMPPSPAPWVGLPASQRPLLVGVLPHPYCNPQVRGCGFCTFPHERFQTSRTAALGRAVAAEITRRAAEVDGRPVPALYLGGGTANLMAPAAFAPIAAALSATLDLCDAEVTLEGAPAYFALHDAGLLRQCLGLDPRRVRISMGVQTFDPSWLRRMGRAGFGSPHHVAAAVELAQRLGVGTSCDLLVNLPGQPVADMIADVTRAAALGFDQICVYPLVLRADLDAAWASDPAMLAAVPSPDDGLSAWREVRAALARLGYRPSTLTNFERDLPPDERFAYEPWSFRPTTCDAIGFGPAALSTAGLGTPVASKWQNTASAGAYLAGMGGGGPVATAFRYTDDEARLAVLTRRLVLLRAELPASHGLDLELITLREAGLIETTRTEVTLTEAGVFYADSVAGLLAERHVAARRLSDDAVPHRMG